MSRGAEGCGYRATPRCLWRWAVTLSKLTWADLVRRDAGAGAGAGAGADSDAGVDADAAAAADDGLLAAHTELARCNARHGCSFQPSRVFGRGLLALSFELPAASRDGRLTRMQTRRSGKGCCRRCCCRSYVFRGRSESAGSGLKRDAMSRCPMSHVCFVGVGVDGGAWRWVRVAWCVERYCIAAWCVRPLVLCCQLLASRTQYTKAWSGLICPKWHSCPSSTYLLHVLHYVPVRACTSPYQKEGTSHHCRKVARAIPARCSLSPCATHPCAGTHTRPRPNLIKSPISNLNLNLASRRHSRPGVAARLPSLRALEDTRGKT